MEFSAYSITQKINSNKSQRAAKHYGRIHVKNQTNYNGDISH